MPLLAEEMGARVQEVSLTEVVPAVVESGVLSDGKLDLVFAVVPETASVKVRHTRIVVVGEHDGAVTWRD